MLLAARYLTALLLLATATPVFAQFGRSSPFSENEENLPATSIFSEQLKRFKFEFEDQLVSVEVVEEFLRRHEEHDEPKILGAYASAKSNALIVVGPPEAEAAIRMTLAKMFVLRQGASPAPLPMQQRTLEFRKRELLREMAELEVAMVAEPEARHAQFADRLKEYEADLEVVEKQLQIVAKYLARLQNDPWTTNQYTRPSYLGPPAGGASKARNTLKKKESVSGKTASSVE